VELCARKQKKSWTRMGRLGGDVREVSESEVWKFSSFCSDTPSSRDRRGGEGQREREREKGGPAQA